MATSHPNAEHDHVFLRTIQRVIDDNRAQSLAHGYAFKERTPTDHTIGDFVHAVFLIQTPEEAQRFFAGYVAYIQHRIDEGTWRGGETAEALARSNIGWCYGEGLSEGMIAMWQEVTGAQHPVFFDGQPSPSEAFAAGITHKESRRRNP